MSNIWDCLRSVRARYMIHDTGRPIALLARADRRTHPRFVTPNLTASIWVDDLEHVVDIRDLSMSGACIDGAPRGLDEGMDVVLATTFEGYGPFVVPCEIMHAEPRADVVRLGIRFMALEQQQTNILFFYLYDLPKQCATEETFATSLAGI